MITATVIALLAFAFCVAYRVDRMETKLKKIEVKVDRRRK